MRKVRVPGEIVDAHPLDGLLFVPRLAQLLDLGLMGTVSSPNHQVASHTGLDRRDARLGRDGDRVMAILALDLVLAGVNVVAEEDRLARPAKVSTVGGSDFW